MVLPRLKTALAHLLFLVAFLCVGVPLTAWSAFAAQESDDHFFHPGNLVVSRSVYDNDAKNVQVGMTLPPNCVVAASCVTATNDGTYPYVFNNAPVDGSFGITSKIVLDQITTDGELVNTLEVPTKQMVTSFSSKSELALNLSTDRQILTFMGYLAGVNALDVSNSNTPGAIDPTNPVGVNIYRTVAAVDTDGNVQSTLTNAYSGNNGRAAILNNTSGAAVIYTAGNAGNGGNPQPNSILIAGGAQILTPGTLPNVPTPVGSFNITQLGQPHDKIGKDNNFRGLTIFNDVLYLSKGSGGNGVNTVYFIDPAGTVCTDTNGVGLPATGATLPTTGLAYNPAVLQSKGLDPNNMCILKGFPSTPNSALTKTTTAYPFGLWFANATTLYVADEGDGSIADATATPAGLQKWVFNATAKQWNMAYVLQSGLGLGATYEFHGSHHYPTGVNPTTGLNWAPLVGGLRNITGRVNDDGTATIWGITSTVSGSGDQGADPNQLVVITDMISATTLPSSERFTVLRTAGFGEVLRGVSFTPGTGVAAH